MHSYSILTLATVALAAPAKRDAQWEGSPWNHGHGGNGGSPPWSSQSPPSWSRPNAFGYFLDNNPAGASIVSLQIAQDGSISSPVRTSTGGLGGISINATNNELVPADSLGSQGSVTVSGNLLFTVNPGSDTISLFSINPQNPGRPTLIGSPVSSQGDFPISITYSPELRKACVLNGGKVAGVSCYKVDQWSGLTIDGPLRKLSTSIIDETTPPNGPPGSAAQVLFSPDSSAVFATVKSNTVNTNGSLLAWPVTNGEISSGAPVVSQFSNIVIDFGFLFLNDNTIFLSDASSGADLLSIDSSFKATELWHVVIPEQAAICWTQYDPALNTLYAIDAGTTEIYKLDPQTGARTGNIAVEESAAGVFDSSIYNGLMYSLAGSNGILVVDLKEEKQVDFLDLSSFGVRQHYQGFAIWEPAAW